VPPVAELPALPNVPPLELPALGTPPALFVPPVVLVVPPVVLVVPPVVLAVPALPPGAELLPEEPASLAPAVDVSPSETGCVPCAHAAKVSRLNSVTRARFAT
jgi:hypothetical protein